MNGTPISSTLKRMLLRITSVLMLLAALRMLMWCLSLINTAVLDDTFAYVGVGCFAAGISYVQRGLERKTEFQTTMKGGIVMAKKKKSKSILLPILIIIYTVLVYATYTSISTLVLGLWGDTVMGTVDSYGNLLIVERK